MFLLLTQLNRVFLKNARAQARHAFPLWAHPADTPADLKDRRPGRNLDAEGNRLTNQVHPIEIGVGPQTAAMVVLSLMPALVLFAIFLPWGLAVAALIVLPMWLESEGVAGAKDEENDGGRNNTKTHSNAYLDNFRLTKAAGLSRFAAVLIVLFFLLSDSGEVAQTITLSLLSLVWLRAPFHYWTVRKEIRKDLNKMGNLLAEDSAGVESFMLERFEHERFEQDERAIADQSTVFTIGEATGMLAQGGDLFSPDAGKPISISLRDLAMHLFCFGTTGTGKTYGVMRQMLRWWIGSLGQSLGGALVLDGKGDLPTEFANIKGFTLISPDNKALKYGVISGLGAEDVTAILVETMSKDEKQDIWSSAAQAHLRNAAFVLEEASKQELEAQSGNQYGWTLVNLAQTMCNVDYRAAVVGMARRAIKSDDDISLLSLAITYFEVEFPAMPDDLRGGAQGQAMSYVVPIIGHRDLFDWCNTSGGFAVEDVCKGACVGLATPSYKYGNPGNAIQALAKARVYKALRERGSKWTDVQGQTRVMILIDECQMLVGEQDMGIASVSRSLGGVLVFATQHIEGLRQKMGKDPAEAMLGNFRNLVCYLSTDETHKYMSGRMGSTVRRVRQPGLGMDYQMLYKMAPSTHGGFDLMQEKECSNAAYTLEIKPSMDIPELAAGVSMRFHAAVMLNRADAPRRDLIRVVPTL